MGWRPSVLHPDQIGSQTSEINVDDRISVCVVVDVSNTFPWRPC
jgi:hypothetical protein